MPENTAFDRTETAGLSGDPVVSVIMIIVTC